MEQNKHKQKRLNPFEWVIVLFSNKFTDIYRNWVFVRNSWQPKQFCFQIFVCCVVMSKKKIFIKMFA